MQPINKDQVNLQKEEFKERIKNGEVFIHPTDTIYGIGCNAQDSASVRKVRNIKNRYQNPFSVIAPSKEWVYRNCEVSEEEKGWIEKLPGPYTIILRLKNKDCIAPETNQGMDTLGVRIPNHWFTSIVAETGIPVITTSANASGKNFMTHINELDPNIRKNMDFIIYEGEKRGSPSTLINLTEEQERVVKR